MGDTRTAVGGGAEKERIERMNSQDPEGTNPKGSGSNLAHAHAC